MLKQFDYRLTETVYNNRVEWEDGPGSLQNVVADISEPRVMLTWLKESDNFGKDLMICHTLNLPGDSPDGRREYTHTLQRRPSGSNDPWKFVGHLHPMEDDVEE